MSSCLRLLGRIAAWRPPPLAFDPPREARFIQACAPARLHHFLVSGIVALLVYNLFLLSDRIMAPDMFDRAVQMRLFLFTPFSLCLVLISTGLRNWVLSLPHQVVEGTVMMTGVLAALTMGIVLVETSSPFGIMYRGGLVAILVYGNLVQRFRFRYALVFSASVLLICTVSMAHTFLRPHPYSVFEIPVGLLILVIAVYTLIMNYRLELDERRRYLRTERAAELRGEIEASRAALDALSRRDALTELPNRRHFDETLQRCWAAHEASSRPLAVLLIDVDHFKAYNDRYGHPTGDQCLRQVAQALHTQIPAHHACVARWGGEEFIAVLEHVHVAHAPAIAQSLVAAVRGLGMRHESSEAAAHVTISVGLAVTVPGHPLSCPDQLVARADEALYRAKREGRDRCVLA